MFEFINDLGGFGKIGIVYPDGRERFGIARQFAKGRFKGTGLDRAGNTLGFEEAFDEFGFGEVARFVNLFRIVHTEL